ncbi:MAG: murein biosynthesis integral membrane protein MurJ [Kiloniellaceae bacterium]
MAFVRSLATVGGYTGISRVLGFLRDILIAAALGTGPVADAFFVAFRLPNLFRRLFAEGAFNAAFVPLFARRLEQEGRGAAKVFAEQSLAVLLAVLLGITAAAMAAMPWLMYVLAPGFAVDPEKFDLTVRLSRIAFPYLLFMAMVALLGGVLNSLYRFAAAAAAPILLNVFFIVALLVVVPLTGAPGHVLAWTVAAAGMGQFLLLVVACRRAGMALRLPRPRLSVGVRRLLTLMVPGILSAGAMQVNIVVGTIIASLQAGAVSYLYYADRVYQLPLGLIGVAFGVVLLPDLSRKLRGGAEREAMHSLNRGLELALLLTLPATVALLVIPWPIVIVLFERGAFDRAASDATAWALAAFASGLPAYVLVKLLQPAFFAREDTMTPLKMAAASVAANVALSLILFWPLGHVGIALATALSAWLNTALLATALRRRGFLALDGRIRARLPRIAAASLAMGGALWAVSSQAGLASWFDGAVALRVFGLAILVAGGLVVYAGLAFALGAVERGELAALARRRA